MSPFRPENRRTTLAVILIAAAIIVIAIGAQALAYARANADRDARDRAYAECLRSAFTTFADDLVESARANRAATEELTRAGERKDATLDRFLRITELATREPPRATREQFDKALDDRVEAQARYREVKARAEVIRDNNPYRELKVECSR